MDLPLFDRGTHLRQVSVQVVNRLNLALSRDVIEQCFLDVRRNPKPGKVVENVRLKS
jgi:hypothetical protein